MNPAKLEQFIGAYADGLMAAIEADPKQYSLKPDDTAESFALRGALTVHRLISTVGLSIINIPAQSCSNACAALKIKHDSQAIADFLEIQPCPA